MKEMKKEEKVVVMGLGHNGLPTATMFAINGFQVLGVDVKSRVVETINEGKIHIDQPGLGEMVKGAVMENNLRASTEPEAGDVFIIAVPTSLTAEKKVDLNYLREATRKLTPYLEKGNLIIIESTISPRTTMDLVVPELAKSGLMVGEELFVAYCPGRVWSGKIINELVDNNQIVIIGGINEKSALMARKFYGSFVEGDIYLTDATTVEMVKLMENTYHDVNKALANELANITAEMEIEASEVIELVNKYPQVNIPQPEPEAEDNWLSVDPWFIIESAPEKAELITLARKKNDRRPKFVVQKVLEKIFGISKPKVSILGITDKDNVDDVKESPILDVIEFLQEKAVELSIFDPYVKESDYQLVEMKEAIHESDCIIIGADHKEFQKLNPVEIAGLMDNRIVFDIRNVLEREKWIGAGFEFIR